jgi:hypothetical protein
MVKRFFVLFFIMFIAGLTWLSADQYKLQVKQDGSPVMASPDQGSKVIMELPKGMIVYAKVLENDWYRISLPSGANQKEQVGYLSRNMANVLEIQQDKESATNQSMASARETEKEAAVSPELFQHTNPKLEIKSKHFVGINVAHSVVVSGISTIIGDNVLYFPIHFDFQFALSNSFGLSGLLMYRYEKDGTYFRTNEIGFAIGPRFSLSKKGVEGFYVACQIGAGFCSGKEYSDSDYYRIDLIIYPEIGYVIPTSGKFGITIGIGLQTLLPIVEDYTGDIWVWKDIGNLSHYYLPVLKLSIGFK